MSKGSNCLLIAVMVKFLMSLSIRPSKTNCAKPKVEDKNNSSIAFGQAEYAAD